MGMIIIFAVIMVPMLIMAGFLLSGRGAFLISGYNMKSKAERERYDEKALCRFAGWLLIAVCASMLIIPVGLHFEIPWSAAVGTAAILIVSLGGAVYANTGNRFLKRDADGNVVELPSEKSGRKATVIVVGVISAVTLVGVGALFYFGERDPRIEIHSDHLQIRAMYGTRVDFSSITEITLLEQSMREIGAGRRTNGYAGNAWKGHFSAGLLFVQPNESPTIRIERERGPDIFISLRGSESTRILYRELTLHLASTRRLAA